MLFSFLLKRSKSAHTHSFLSSAIHLHFHLLCPLFNCISCVLLTPASPVSYLHLHLLCPLFNFGRQVYIQYFLSLRLRNLLSVGRVQLGQVFTSCQFVKISSKLQDILTQTLCFPSSEINSILRK